MTFERRIHDIDVPGVPESPTGPFPYAEDQINARDKIICALWAASGDAVESLDRDHADLLRDILDAGE